MNSLDWQIWRLVVKLDPDKEIGEEELNLILNDGADAVIVGGTQNITAENTSALIDRIRATGYRGPLIQEISQLKAINYAVNGYAIPVLLNAEDTHWITGAHHQAIKELGRIIDWHVVIPFGYIVGNPDSAVGRLTGVKLLTTEDAVAYATLADKIFHLPIIYIEYSGIYGDTELVKKVSAAAGTARIFYGGGIYTIAQAKSMLEIVDTIVIGNALYDNPTLVQEIKKSLPF